MMQPARKEVAPSRGAAGARAWNSCSIRPHINEARCTLSLSGQAGIKAKNACMDVDTRWLILHMSWHGWRNGMHVKHFKEYDMACCYFLGHF